eukprot:SAG31_NODE_202_length_20512_cov_62.659237_11_plen_3224_part_00
MLLGWLLAKRQEKAGGEPYTRWGAVKRAGGFVLLVKGVVLASVGGACMEDVLLGVESCNGRWSATAAHPSRDLPFFSDLGISLVIVGSVLYIPGLYVVLYYCIPAMSRTLSFSLGYLVSVAGLILFGTGTACLAGRMYGVEDCRHGGVKLTMAAIIVTALGLLLFSWGHPVVSKRYREVYRTWPALIGFALLCAGTVLTYWGWLVAENVWHGRSVVPLSIGLSLQLKALYFLATAYFWRNSGSAEGSGSSLLTLLPGNLTGKKVESSANDEGNGGGNGGGTEKNSKWYCSPLMPLGILCICVGTVFVISGSATMNGARHLVELEHLDEEGSSWETDVAWEWDDGLTEGDGVWYDQSVHDKGIVLVISGAVMVFVGLLLLGTVACTSAVQIMVLFAAEVFLAGLTLVVVGKMCLSDGLPGVPRCAEHNAFIMIPVGSLALFSSLVPSVFAFLYLKKPDLVQSHRFKVGALLFMVSSVGVAFGYSCYENLVLGVEQCDRFGRWSLAVTLLFWCGWGLFISVLLMSSVAMSAEYARLGARMRKLVQRKNVLILIGLPLMAIAFIMGWVGAACIDGALLQDCKPDGFALVALGCSLFVLGFFMTYVACDWTWPDDEDGPRLPDRAEQNTAKSTKDEAFADFFNKYDKDGDGNINIAELQKMMDDIGQHLSEEEAAHFREFLDSNHDNMVTMPEISALFARISPVDETGNATENTADSTADSTAGLLKSTAADADANSNESKTGGARSNLKVPMLVWGIFMILVGAGCILTGWACLGDVEYIDGQSLLWSKGTPRCPRDKGVAYTQFGLGSCFVGLLFVGCSVASNRAVRAWLAVMLGFEIIGAGILVLGLQCLMKKMGGRGICTPKLDGIMLTVVGGTLTGLPLIASVYYLMYRQFPAVFGAKMFAFGILLWAGGVVAGSFGIACWTDNMVGMRDCYRPGRWTGTVKLLFGGGWLFAIGLFFMSLVVFSAGYSRLRVRMRLLWVKKNPFFLSSWLLIFAGVVYAVVGGACIDGVLLDCSSAAVSTKSIGFERVAAGVSAFLLGFYILYLTCKWELADTSGRSVDQQMMFAEMVKKYDPDSTGMIEDENLQIMVDEIKAKLAATHREKFVAFLQQHEDCLITLHSLSDYFTSVPSETENLASAGSEARVPTEKSISEPEAEFSEPEAEIVQKETTDLSTAEAGSEKESLNSELAPSSAPSVTSSSMSREASEPCDAQQAKGADFVDVWMLILAIFSVVCGAIFLSNGFDCLGKVEYLDVTGLESLSLVWSLGRPLCPRYQGIAFAQMGAVFIFIGLLFGGSAFRAMRVNGYRVWAVITVASLACGTPLLHLGLQCLMKKMGGRGVCTPKADGIMLTVVGGTLTGLPLIGAVWCLLLIRWPEIVGTKMFAFGTLLWAGGVVAGSFGIACWTDNMVGIKGCYRPGRWTGTVKLLFGGGWLFAIGLFFMSLVVFSAGYSRLRVRMRLLWEQRRPAYILSCAMMILGIVLASVGGACLDGELLSACPNAGTACVSLGPSMFMLGFFLFYISCDWMYSETGPAPPPEEHETRMSLLQREADAAAEVEDRSLSLVPMETSSAPISSPSNATSKCSSNEADRTVVVMRQSKGMIAIGLVLSLLSVSFIWTGASCLNVNGLHTCPHRRGVILTVIGSVAAYVSVLFIGCAQATSTNTVFSVAAADTITSGLILLVAGGLCAGNAFPNVQNCRRTDGDIIMLTGAPLVIFTALPTTYVLLVKKRPELMKKPLFWIGAVMFLGGMTSICIGFACAQDRLYSVEDCGRRGRWNSAVHLMFWGNLFFWLGVLLMSFVMSNPAYVRLGKRMSYLLRRKHPGFLIGMLLLVIGFIYIVSATFCLDGTFVHDCEDDGLNYMSNGIPLFLLGYFFVFTSCDWPCTDDYKDGDSETSQTAESEADPDDVKVDGVNCPMADMSPLTPLHRHADGEPPPSPVSLADTNSMFSTESSASDKTSSSYQEAYQRRPLFQRKDLYIGVLMVLVGLVCFSGGYDCISKGPALCKRLKGMTYLQSGFASISVGVLFVGCSVLERRTHMLGGVVLLNMLLSGGVVLAFGILCVSKNMDANVCHYKEDGIPLTVGGGTVTGLPIIATIYGVLWFVRPEIVAKKTFLIGSLVWAGGVVAGSFGIACWTDNMVGMRDCYRPGRWTGTVKLLFGGGWLFAIGLFFMSIAILGDRYSRLLLRIRSIWKTPLFVLGLMAMVVGIVIGSLGGACLDGGLYDGQDCIATGTSLLALGPPLFLTGFFFFYWACDWNWTTAGAEARRAAKLEQELERMRIASVPTMELLADDIAAAHVGGPSSLLQWETMQDLSGDFTEEQEKFLADLAVTLSPMTEYQLKVKLDALLVKKQKQDAENVIFEAHGGHEKMRQLEKTVSHTASAADATADRTESNLSDGLARSTSLTRISLSAPTSSAEAIDVLAQLEAKSKLERSNNRPDGMVMVTVVGCTDLLAADANGKSDPYVQLSMRNTSLQGIKPWRTRTVEKNLNPEFGETFSFSVGAGEDDHTMVVDVMDHDHIGHDDQIGRLEINLDEVFVHWEDNEMVERVFDLGDGDGKVSSKFLLTAKDADNPCGTVNLKLVYADAGKLRPPCSGVVSIAVKSCTGLVAGDSNGKSDPYVLLGLGPANLLRTRTKHSTVNPSYNQHFDFSVDADGPACDYQLDMEVRDANMISEDDVLGLLSVSLGTIFEANDWREYSGETAVEQEFDLTSGGGIVKLKSNAGQHPYGRILLQFEFTDGSRLLPKLGGCGCGYKGLRAPSMYIGLFLIFISIPLLQIGSGHLDRPMDMGAQWYSSRRGGIILLINGSVALFLGFLYFSFSWVERGVHVWLLISLDLACFGTVMALLGSSCTDGNSNSCTESEGYFMVLFGGGLIFLSIYPPICGFCAKFFGEIVKKTSFICGFSLVTLGVIVTSFSIACYRDSILGVNNCDNRGKWSVAVHLLFWGLLSLGCGLFGMAVAKFDTFFDNRWKRFVAVSRQPTLWIGIILFAISAVLVGFGGACADDTLIGVDDCQSAGTVLLSTGLPGMFFGFFFIVLAHVWEWESDRQVDDAAQQQLKGASSAEESKSDADLLTSHSETSSAPFHAADDRDDDRLSLRSPSYANSYQPVVSRSVIGRCTFWYGLAFAVCGSALTPVGVTCLNVDHRAPLPPDSCPHQRGVILTVAGSTALFVGVLFIGLTWTRTGHTMAHIVAGDFFAYAVVLSGTGWLCIGEALPGTNMHID